MSSYVRKGSILLSLSGSPALCPNNLSTCDGMLTYVRSNSVAVSNLAGECKVLPELSKCIIYGSCYVSISSTPILVVVTSVGMQLWSGDGSDMMHLCSLATMFEQDPLEEDSVAAAEKHYLRGVAGVGTADLAIGCSNGSTFVFNVFCNRSSMNVELCKTLSGNSKKRSAVVACAGSEELLVVGHENGEMCVYNGSDGFQQSCVLSPDNMPKVDGVGAGTNGLITSLITHGDTIVAGYSTGHLRIYRASIQELAIEITAHVRCITGLCLHPVYRNVMVSCGEDEYFHVWDFPDFLTRSSSSVDLICSQKADNKLCTGVGFANVVGDDGGNPTEAILVAFYDDDAVGVYRKC